MPQTCHLWRRDHVFVMNRSECCAQWRRGRGRARGRGQLPPKFWAVKNVVVVGKFLSKVQNLGLKTFILGKFMGKIEILSTYDLLYWKFAAVWRKIATPCPADIFFNLQLCRLCYILVKSLRICSTGEEHLAGACFRSPSGILIFFETQCTCDLITRCMPHFDVLG